MASTFTANINLEEPARGDDVGTWDTPVNNNMTLVDLVAGGQSKITLNNANVTLSAAQFQSNIITFQSTLTGSVTITFPSTFKKPYTVEHLCTGSSAFTITLQTTVAGGQAIVCPPGRASTTTMTGRTSSSRISARRSAAIGIIAARRCPRGCRAAPCRHISTATERLSRRPPIHNSP